MGRGAEFQGLEYRRGGGGAREGGRIPRTHTTSMRRNDVALTSFQHHVPTRFLINHYISHLKI